MSDAKPQFRQHPLDASIDEHGNVILVQVGVKVVLRPGQLRQLAQWVDSQYEAPDGERWAFDPRAVS